MIDTILLDLDGTLLPLEQEKFIIDYFKEVRNYFQELGFNHELILKAIMVGTTSMLNNDGQESNEKVFAKNFNSIAQIEYEKIENDFSIFYEERFDCLKIHAQLNPLAKEIVNNLKEKGYSIILATNPVFPRIATLKRIAWAGLNHQDFKLITTFENSSFCKPNLNYYLEILEQVNKKPSQTIMIGNDIDEDMIVQEINIETYLLIDKLINKNNKDINNFRHGNFQQLYDFIKKLPNLND